MHWSTYTVSVDMSASTTVWFDRLGVPWSADIREHDGRHEQRNPR